MDLTEGAAQTFTAGHIGVEHAMLIVVGCKVAVKTMGQSLFLRLGRELGGCVETTNESKDDDPLTEAAALFKVDTKALRAAAAKEGKEKTEKKRKMSGSHSKSKAA